MSRALHALTFACALTALAPFAREGTAPAPSAWSGPPEEVPAGATRLPLEGTEARVAAAFPDSVERYRTDDALYLVRRARGASRRLHASAECLRAAGWQVTLLPPTRDAHANGWASYAAAREGEAESLRLDERVRCEDGATFTDVGLSFWHALASSGDLGCTAVTRVTRR